MRPRLKPSLAKLATAAKEGIILPEKEKLILPGEELIRRTDPPKFKQSRGDKVVDFCQTLRVPSGKDVGLMVNLRDWQVNIIKGIYDAVDDRGIRLCREACITMGRKNAKALALDTVIPTPDGPKVMGDIKVDDTLYDERGYECGVTDVSEIFTGHDCYELTFNNAEVVVADAGHLWQVHSRDYRRGRFPHIVTTEQLFKTQVYFQDEDVPEINHRISIPGTYSAEILMIRKVQSVPTKCIAVDSPHHLFRIGNQGIYTHNTTMGAMLTLAHLVGPEVMRNAELYSAGFRRDQSAIIWRAVYQMVSVDDELSFYCSWSRTQKTFDCGVFGTTYKAISAEAKSKHGFNPAFVILDELSQFGSDRDLYDVFKTSVGAQEESLLLTMSTQAADDTAIMSEIVDYGLQVESGDIVDPSFKLFAFWAEEYDDIYDRATWDKANPALGDFRDLKEMEQMADRAKRSPPAEQTFRNLYLNIRTASTVSIVSSMTWRQNGGKVDLDYLVGRQCYVGLDLSSKQDLTAMVAVFPDDECVTFDILPFFFTPAESLPDRAKLSRVPYDVWANEGYLEACPGISIDYRLVAKRLIALFNIYDVQVIVYDRWRIDIFKTFMENEGFDLESVEWLEMGQGFRDMSPAIDILEEDCLACNLRHGMHPVLTFNVASAKASMDPAGNRKFDKVRSTGKIDGTVAMTMALSAAHLSITSNAGSVYERRGPVTLSSGPTPPSERFGNTSVWDRLDNF